MHNGVNAYYEPEPPITALAFVPEQPTTFKVAFSGEINFYNGGAKMEVRGTSIQGETWYRTAQFDGPRLEQRNRILAAAVHNLTRMYRLSDQYIDMLQGGITEEEYMALAKEHKRYPRDLSDQKIAIEAKVLLEAADTEMDSAEIADILNLNTLAVEKALAEYSTSGGGECLFE